MGTQAPMVGRSPAPHTKTKVVYGVEKETKLEIVQMEMLEGMMIIWNTSWNNDNAQVGKVRVMSDGIMICSGLKPKQP